MADNSIVNIGGKILAGFVVLILLGLGGWQWYTEHSGKILEHDHVVRLQSDSLKLIIRSVTAENKVLTLTSELIKASTLSATYQQDLEKARDQTVSTIDKLNALAAKKAADKGVISSRVATILPTSVNDSTVNKIIAKQAGIIQVYEDSLPKLHTALGAMKVRAESAEGKASDLENVLNGRTTSVIEDFDNSIKEKHFLGWGQKASKKALKAKVVRTLTPAYRN